MLPAFGLINRLQVGDTGPVELSNSRVLGSPFSGLSGQLPSIDVHASRFWYVSAKSINYSGEKKKFHTGRTVLFIQVSISI